MEIILEKEKMEINELFITYVGSHVWKMNRPQSDIDKFVVYLTSTSDILTKGYNNRSKCKHYVNDEEGEDKEDIVIHEIGTVVNRILDGNINFLIGVLSPIVIKDSGYLSQLKELTMANLSKKSFHSIHGLAVHNYKKYILTEKDISEKRCNTVARVLNFGIVLLSKGDIEFNPVKGTKPEDIPPLIDKLDIAYKNSVLPSEPCYYHEMMEWLIGIRMEEFVNEREEYLLYHKKIR